jgi:hypothetical protein
MHRRGPKRTAREVPTWVLNENRVDHVHLREHVCLPLLLDALDLDRDTA